MPPGMKLRKRLKFKTSQEKREYNAGKTENGPINY